MSPVFPPAWGIARARPGDTERATIASAVERIVALSPHLRAASNHTARLERAASAALRYVAGLVAQAAPAREASARAWSADPYIRAFFSGPDAVAPALARAPELRAFFAQHAGAQEAFGVLGMNMVERRTFGTVLEGEVLRRDVQQLTIGFTDHQLRLFATDESALRDTIVGHLLVELGVRGLANYASEASQRDLLERERALLKTRLQLLDRQGMGIGALLGPAQRAGTADAAGLQAALAENECELERLGTRADALERELAAVCAVLAEPGRHLYIETRRLVLNRINVVLPDASRADGDELAL